jgi:carbonic anhydrase
MTDKLLEGFQSFRQFHYETDDPLIHRLIVEGQKPEYFIISCIDSRANPATIFRAQPGTFFNFMAMGAIVRPYKLGTALAAALQFALGYSGVLKLIILGHTHCGAIKALAEEIVDPEIASFIDVAHEGFERAKCGCGAHDHEALLRATEQEIVLQSMENLKSYPSVAKALAAGKLEIHGWVFDMEGGQMLEHKDGKWGQITMSPCLVAADQRTL